MPPFVGLAARPIGAPGNDRATSDPIEDRLDQLLLIPPTRSERLDHDARKRRKAATPTLPIEDFVEARLDLGHELIAAPVHGPDRRGPASGLAQRLTQLVHETRQ